LKNAVRGRIKKIIRICISLTTLLSIVVALVTFCPALAWASAPGPREFLNTPVNEGVYFFDFSGGTRETAVESDLPEPNNETVSRAGALSILYSYPLGNKYGGVGLTIPYATVQINGPLGNSGTSGFGDPAIAFHANIFGLPALRRSQFSNATPQTFLTFHLTVNVPLGSYDANSPVNVGANRWTFTPLLNLDITPDKGVSWIDLYASGRFFTNNDAFLVSNQLSQNPVGMFAAHYSHNIGKQMWAAISVYHDIGGETFVNHVPQGNAANDFQPGVGVSSKIGSFRLTLNYKLSGSTPNAAPTNGELALKLSCPPL
jgi:hypothetical protein